MPSVADSQSIRSTSTAVHAFELDDKPVDPFLVRFSPGDPENPKVCCAHFQYRLISLYIAQNWSRIKRWYLTMTGGLLVLCATYSSSAPSPILPLLLRKFGFSTEVAILTISVFVGGYCVGPLLWAPLSEQYGRRPIFILSFFGLLCFQIGCALSNNTATIIILRFLGGVFAACPLANSGALISDIWGPKERGAALAIFTVAPFAGPAIGPVVGGYLYQAGVSWRWTFWILVIFSGVCLLQIVFTVPETFEPVLLLKAAREKRRNTGDERYYAAMETTSMKFKDRLEAILALPFKVLFQEPILMALTIYMSFVYGCIYLLFEAYPVVYTEGHHLEPGPSGLVYLPIPVGSFISVVVYVLFINTDYARKVEEYAPDPVPPEYRLRVAMIASPLFAISFFWFAWTSFPNISIWVPMASALVLGFSICWMFLALFNYIIDVYLSIAASALAATVVVRSAFGAGFPASMYLLEGKLFASQMYAKLGPQWASSLVAFIALAMTPVPFILTKYGPAIRSKSKFAPPRPPVRMSV
ncbi:major facilitator superfamily domain-containing protein [Chiua virens]|nr:major facilitator superfamily domain-containing protein [Chiua virens]